MSSENTKPTSRVAIIGVGQVGAAVAYAIVLGSVVDELLLVDVKTGLRNAHIQDLSDVAYCKGSRISVRAATPHEAGQCDIVVITIGSKYYLGQTSIQQIKQNVSTLQGVIRAMRPMKSDAILLVVSNPVDLLTSIAAETSGLPKAQVLGSGTFLDSVRLRGLLMDKIKVAANSINLYVLGVHGNSQVTAWSSSTIGGAPINTVNLPKDFNPKELEDEGRKNSESIIKAKGTMPFGIGSIVCSICTSIISDKRNVRPVSHFQPEFGCCFSLPVVIGRMGVLQSVQVPLSEAENAKLTESVKALKGLIKQHDEKRNEE